MGDTKDVTVDYYMIIDVTNSQALTISQRTGKQTVAGPPPGATPPKLSFLMCHGPNTQTPQIHQFVKISDTIDGAPAILRESTGLQLPNPQPTLSDLWQGLVASGYFSKTPGVTFAGSFFMPLQIRPVASASGPAGVSFQWNAAYRGGGTMQFTTEGVESAQFVGTTATAGDFLVSSPGNGQAWKAEVASAAAYSFDKVVLGPLQ